MVYIGFVDLKKAYDRINKEALRQVLRMYNVGSKLLININRADVSEVIVM